MTSFKDKLGREWRIRLTDENILKVLRKLDRKTFENLALSSQINLTHQALFITIGKQAGKRRVSFGDFSDAMTADATETATQALAAALTNFKRK